MIMRLNKKVQNTI